MEQTWISAHPARPEQLIFKRPQSNEVFQPGDILYRMGRDAIYHGLKALAATGDSRDTVLVPSFHCASQIDAAEAAGLRCAFYPLNPDATVDLEQLASRITDDVLTVMVIHYYGWPLDIDGLTRLAEARRVTLFEDCALALFSQYKGQPVGRFGGLSIFSLRKSLPVRDGGILRINRPELRADPPVRTHSSLRPAVGALARALGARKLVQWGKALVGRKSNGHSQAEEAAPYSPEALEQGGERKPDFDVELSDVGISSFSSYIARRAHPEQVVERRRSIYRRLDEELRGHPGYAPLFHDLPDGVCPLSLVIVHPRRDEVEHNLRESDVEAYCFGRYPHPRLDVEQYPETRVLCDQTLALPVHQDLTDVEVERVARAIHATL